MEVLSFFFLRYGSADMNTGYVEIDDQYYLRHVPTARKVGLVKLRLAPREIPAPQTDDRTYTVDEDGDI